MKLQIVAVLLIVGLSACSSKLPQTQAIEGLEAEEAQARFTSFLQQDCVQAVDGDIRLSWKAFGQHESYPAQLQAAQSALIRLALVDPLGRPLLLLASDGRTFTLVDNRQSVAYTGATENQALRRFLPAFIPTEDIFLWLSGQVPLEKMRAAKVRRDAAGKLWWYGAPAAPGTVHVVELDQFNRLHRHLIVEEKNDLVLFEARYSDYSKSPAACAWPQRIDFSGKRLEADYSVEFTEIISFTPPRPEQFDLRIPPHFTRKRIEDL
jgi:outer membrane biogenesis lipoprotein LolB